MFGSASTAPQLETKFLARSLLFEKFSLKEIFKGCCLLFSYQGSCRSLSSDSFNGLSKLFRFVKNFFYFPSRVSLNILPLFTAICQPFFTSFFNSFSGLPRQWCMVFQNDIIHNATLLYLSGACSFTGFRKNKNYWLSSSSFWITSNGEGGIWTLAPLLTTYSLSRGAPSASLGTSPQSGEGGIRTHAPFRTNGFQDRLVMTTSIPLHLLPLSDKLDCMSPLRRWLFYHITLVHVNQFFTFSEMLLQFPYLPGLLSLCFHRNLQTFAPENRAFSPPP